MINRRLMQAAAALNQAECSKSGQHGQRGNRRPLQRVSALPATLRPANVQRSGHPQGSSQPCSACQKFSNSSCTSVKGCANAQTFLIDTGSSPIHDINGVAADPLSGIYSPLVQSYLSINVHVCEWSNWCIVNKHRALSRDNLG